MLHVLSFLLLRFSSCVKGDNPQPISAASVLICCVIGVRVSQLYSMMTIISYNYNGPSLRTLLLMYSLNHQKETDPVKFFLCVSNLTHYESQLGNYRSSDPRMPTVKENFFPESQDNSCGHYHTLYSCFATPIWHLLCRKFVCSIRYDMIRSIK
jgi:hypothetical protein